MIKKIKDKMKLYVKVSCTICRKKNMGCPYCDILGETYVEAVDTIVNKWLSTVGAERQKEFLSFLNEELRLSSEKDNLDSF